MAEIDDVLAHYGVPGMKWGRRKSRSLGTASNDPEPVTLKLKPGTRVKAEGGGGRSASEDAKAAAAYRQIARKSGVDALTNDQPRRLTARIELESRYSKIAAADNPKSKGRKFAESFLKEEITRVVSGRDPQVVMIGKALSGGAQGAHVIKTRAKNPNKGYTGRHAS